jgi:hypothetical protein
MAHREAITLFQYTVTTDKAAFASTNRAYAGRRLARLRPPYILSWVSGNAGTGAPSGTISMIANIQDSDDGVTWTAIAAWTVASNAAAGALTKLKAYGSQIRKYVRVVGKTLAAATWASGSTLTAILTGEVD